MCVCPDVMGKKVPTWIEIPEMFDLVGTFFGPHEEKLIIIFYNRMHKVGVVGIEYILYRIKIKVPMKHGNPTSVCLCTCVVMLKV